MTQVASVRGVVIELDAKQAQLQNAAQQSQQQQQQQQKQQQQQQRTSGSNGPGEELEIPPPDRGIMKMWNSFPVKCILADEDLATLRELNPSTPLNDTVVEFIVPRQGFLFLHRECVLDKFAKLFTQYSTDDMWFTSPGGRIVRWQTPLTTLFDIRLAESVMSDQAVQASLYSSPSSRSGSNLNTPRGVSASTNPRMRTQTNFHTPRSPTSPNFQANSGSGGATAGGGADDAGIEDMDTVDQLLPLMLYVHVKPPPAPKKTDSKELKEALKEKSDQMLRIKDDRTGFEIYEQLMKQSLAIRFGSAAALTQLREKHEDLYLNLFICVKNNLPAPYLRSRYALLNCMSDVQSTHYPVIFHMNQRCTMRKVAAEFNTLGKLLKQYVPEFSVLQPQDLVANREALLLVKNAGAEVSETVVVIQGVIPFLSTPMDQLLELCMGVDLFLHVVVHTRVKER